MPSDGFDFDDGLPMAREAIITWLAQYDSLRDEDFLTGNNPKWVIRSAIPASCELPQYQN